MKTESNFRDIKEISMSDNDFREVIDGEENKEPTASDNNLHTTDAESAEVVTGTTEEKSDEKKDDEYEEICYICHRPEHIAGKMIKIPNSISICHDCMQRTFDSMNGTGFPMGDMMNMGSFNNMNLDKMPNISMINLSDLQNMMGGMPNSQKIRKKKPKEERKPEIDIHAIPAPHKIKASLDEYVVGQEHAKKVMSVAVYNHYKRIASDVQDGVEIEKSNMLMIGPTGSGKTYLVKTLARLLDVPLAITDATSLTEAGYIGDDIESVVSKLLAAADNDVERAEHGIIFIDEIDKIAKKRNTNQRDVSGESVQQGMLKLLEGAEVEVPVGASSKNAMVPMTMVNTKNILFICGGAFPDLEDIIKERLNKEASIGFKADLKDKYDNDENLLAKVTTEDVRKFGMIPEFLGRLPVMFTLEALTEDMLVRILKEPKNAIIRQYEKLLAMDEVKLVFDEDALHSIAKEAKEKKVGARALRSIIEDFMLDIMYEIPKDDNIGMVTITKDYVEKKGGPLITMRGCAAIEEKPAI
jgi:ATP-dependent Clp protease ATP-binding subunit ClpX